MMCDIDVRVAINPAGITLEVDQSNSEVKITGGYEAELFEILLRFFAPRYKIILNPDNEWGRVLADGSWTGLIGMLQKNKADIGLGSLAPTEKRMTVVDFSSAYDTVAHVFMTRSPQLLPRVIAILQPFSGSLWITLCLAVLLVVTIVWRVFDRDSSLVSILLNFFRLASLRIDAQSVRHLSGRILYGTYVMAFMIIQFSYVAVLLTLLTIPRRDSGLRSISDLTEAVQSGTYKCYTAKGSSLVELLAQSKDASIKTLGKSIEENDWFISSTFDEIKRVVFNERAAMILLKFLTKQFPPTSVLIPDDYFHITQVAVAMRKDFSCAKKLNKIIRRITEGGLYEKSFNDFMFKKSEKIDYETDVKLSLSVEDFMQVNVHFEIIE
ncbi:glutamate receptor ionotropic, delta-2-like [Uloborus diversus]|uniref:glutamate receptor ionotropic, delta-2-like n=1 Tax=Uloborus diversus TaxID=327109 RepID=UPI0024097CE9|nr:glutamate receptor ionotropic, delta-2-like [Uloborus diversus]